MYVCICIYAYIYIYTYIIDINIDIDLYIYIYIYSSIYLKLLILLILKDQGGRPNPHSTSIPASCRRQQSPGTTTKACNLAKSACACKQKHDQQKHQITIKYFITFTAVNVKSNNHNQTTNEQTRKSNLNAKQKDQNLASLLMATRLATKWASRFHVLSLR